MCGKLAVQIKRYLKQLHMNVWNEMGAKEDRAAIAENGIARLPRPLVMFAY